MRRHGKGDAEDHGSLEEAGVCVDLGCTLRGWEKPVEADRLCAPPIRCPQ